MEIKSLPVKSVVADSVIYNGISPKNGANKYLGIKRLRFNNSFTV